METKIWTPFWGKKKTIRRTLERVQILHPALGFALIIVFFCRWLLGCVPDGSSFSQLNSGVEDAMVISTTWWVTSLQHWQSSASTHNLCIRASGCRWQVPSSPSTRSVFAGGCLGWSRAERPSASRTKVSETQSKMTVVRKRKWHDKPFIDWDKFWQVWAVFKSSENKT